MNWETNIGLEVHVELNTASKISAPAPRFSGRSPEPVLSGLYRQPGALPAFNKKVLNTPSALASPWAARLQT